MSVQSLGGWRARFGIVLLAAFLTACTLPRATNTPSRSILATGVPSSAASAPAFVVTTPCPAGVGHSIPTSLPLINPDDARRAVALANGEVLIISRDSQGSLFGATFDVSTDHLTPITLSNYRGEFDWLLPVPQGRIVGGILLGGDSLAYAEYDPSTRRFGDIAIVALPGEGKPAALGARAVALANGDLLLVASKYAWRIQLAQRLAIPTVAKVSSAYTNLVLLTDGRVMAIGGQEFAFDVGLPTNEAEIYDPQRDEWRAVPHPPVNPFGGYSLAALADGRVLLLSGRGDRVSATSWGGAYDPVAHVWVPRASLPLPLVSHRAVTLPDGSVLVTGGRTLGPSANERGVYRYHPSEDRWETLRPMLVGRSNHGVALLPDGRILLLQGGGTGAAPTSELYSLDCAP